MPERIATKPYLSRRQQRWAFANKKPFAKRWANETPSFAALPEKKDAGIVAGAMATPGMGRLRARLKSALGITTKPMTRSEAARVAALARWNKTPRKAKPPTKARAVAQTEQERAETRQAKQRERDAARIQERAENRANVLRSLNIAPDGAEALDRLRNGEQPDPAAIARAGFVDAGLVEQAADGSYRMTPAGRAVLAAADAGDRGRAGDTISGGRDRVGTRRQRQQAAAERKKKPPKAAVAGGGKEKPKPTIDIAGRMARVNSRLARMRKRRNRRPSAPVTAGSATPQLYRRDGSSLDLRQTTKAQAAEQRAMFAKMGGGGKGGGGAKTTGGGVQSTLWAKGPDGKRIPQAGFQGRARPADPGRAQGGQTVGNSTKAYGADPNTSYSMRHELVDMDSIHASNTANGTINPKYDPSLQPRDRSRASSQAQITEVARKLNPDVLTTDFHRIDAGSPIIDKHGNVLSGNGRTLALQRAGEMHPEKLKEYRDAIKAQAREAGIDPAAIDKMKNPVLVRRLQGDTDPAAFAREANSSGTLRMSPLEQAKVDAGTIGHDHMLKLHVIEGQDIDRSLRDKSNKPFVSEFLNTVPSNERANLLTRDGDLNQMGLYRIKAAVYTRAFPGAHGERMAESMLESLDPDVKQIQNGISGGLPALSRAQSLIRSGQREPHLDISEDLAKTIDVYARIKDNPALTANTPANQLVHKYLSQSSMFGRELNDEQERMLVHIDSISRSPTRVRSFLERYARIVENEPQPGQTGLFGEVTNLTRSQLLDALFAEDTAQKAAMKAMRTDLPLLPPVRKRTSYGDIKKTDLVMALFHDQIAPITAMREGEGLENPTAYKAQTAEDRAMFAKMGGGGKGGSGGGSAGGAAANWPKGPDGKRHPSASQVDAMQAKLDTRRERLEKNPPADKTRAHRERSDIKRRQFDLNENKERATHALDKTDHQLRNKRREIINRQRRAPAGSAELRDLGHYLNEIDDAINTTKRKRREIEMAGKSFTVYKSFDGTPRWLARTTTAYRDRDREILPVATLDQDSQRMTAAGQFGPLRMWHLGRPNPLDAAEPWGPGVDVGDCDFSMQVGRTRVESGTFKSAALATRIAATASEYELSPGFFHPPDQPDASGVFTTIRTFERSLVPTKYGRASNYFTGLTVKEQRMDPQEENRRLKAVISQLGLDQQAANALAAGIAQSDKSAQAQGIAYKSDDTITINGVTYKAEAPEAEPLPDVVINGVTYKALPPKFLEQPAEEKADFEEGEAVGEELAEGMDDQALIGAIADAVVAKIAPLFGDMKMSEMKDMFATKDDSRAQEIAALKTSLEQQQTALAKTQTDLAALQGFQPAAPMPADIDAALKSKGPTAPPTQPIISDPSRPFAAVAANLFPELYNPSN